jgi:hypothetical protein
VDEPFIKVSQEPAVIGPQKHSSSSMVAIHDTSRPAKRIRLVGLEPSDSDAVRSSLPALDVEADTCFSEPPQMATMLPTPPVGTAGAEDLIESPINTKSPSKKRRHVSFA